MTLPSPGWYKDPLDQDRQKWWDGAAWTEYTLPLSSGTSTGPGTSAETAESAVSSPQGRLPDEPAAEGFTGCGRTVPGAGSSLGAGSYPGTQGYPGGRQQGYPSTQGDALGQGYTDQPGSPGYSDYQRGYAGSHPAYTGYPGYPGHASSAQRSNPAALTGFILGIAAFFLFFIPFLGTGTALGAGTFSVIGLAKQGSDRAPMYKVFAIIGLVLGIIFTLLSVLVLVLVLVFASPSTTSTSTSYWV